MRCDHSQPFAATRGALPGTSMGRDDYSVTTLPPWAVQLTTSVVSVQPWPLQAFWPLQDDEAVLQALVPLHELAPAHFTAAWAAVAKLPAAKIAVAVAMRVFLVMSHSLTGSQVAARVTPQAKHDSCLIRREVSAWRRSVNFRSPLREAGRRKSSRAHTQPSDIAGHAFAQRQARRKPPCGVSRLDAIAAVARQPEQAVDHGVVAHDQVLVGDEAPEARPFVLDAPDFQRRRRLDALDGDGDVHLLRLGVAGRRGCLVGRRAQELADLGLDVPGLVEVDDHRQVREVDSGGRVKGKSGAPLRDQADRRCAGPSC